jgi:hypothetical protein
MNDPHLNLDNFWMPFTANRQFKAKPGESASLERLGASPQTL